MHILMVTPEANPFARSGGLAEGINALSWALVRLGHQVTVVLPLYRQVQEAGIPVSFTGQTLSIPISWKNVPAEIHQAQLDHGLTFYFIGQDALFNREGLYGTAYGAFEDNAERFIFFSRAVVEMMEALELEADICHCHEWQTGLVPVYLRTLYSDRPRLQKLAVVYTVHNVGYQGLFSSFIHQLFSPYGLVYLKYIFGALFTRPSLFVLAVSKAVMGHHFFKITDEIVKSDKFKLYLEEKLYSLETRLEKMDDTLVEKPVLKLLSFHKNMIAKIRTNIIKLSKKTDSNLEHSLDAFSANVKTYLNNFVEVVREKARSIDLSVLKGNLEKIKPSIVAKMDKIRKNYHKRGRLVREYFHDTYQKIEEQITILIDIIERKSAIPVGADS